MEQIKAIERPVEIPPSGLLCDLVWSDPDNSVKNWRRNFQRGTSFIFGKAVVTSFLKRHNFDLICRAHEAVGAGYQFFGGVDLVTIFSSTNNETNKAMYMHVSETLHCTFHRITNYE